MAHICPWWLVYTFDNAIRRLFHNPEAFFGPYVKPGMIVLDVGCGRGFNAIGLAHMVGEEGRVIAVDVQREMLNMLERRAERAGLADRIHSHLCETDTLGLEGTMDFVNAFWMVHEVPDTREFLKQIYSILNSEGRFLVAEPKFHVSLEKFQNMITTAQDVGFRILDEARVAFSRAVVFLRP